MLSKERVAAQYMGLLIEEVNGRVEVSGSYPAIKDYIPALKKMKFRYDGATKKWWNSVSSKLTEKTVAEKLFGTESERETKQEEAAKEVEELKEKNTHIFQNFVKNKFDFFQVELHHNGMLVSGRTYPLRDVFRSVNAEWLGTFKKYLVPFDAPKLETLTTSIEKAEARYQERKSDIEAHIKGLSASGVEFSVVRDLLVLKFGKPVKFRLSTIFEFVRRYGSDFAVPVETVTTQSLDRLVDVLAKEHQETLHKQDEELQKKEENDRLGIKIMERTSRPYTVGEVFETRDGAVTVIKVHKSVWMDAADSMSFGFFMDRDGYVYKASVRPATEAEMERSGLLAARKERVKAQEISKARDELKKLIQAHGTIPAGEHRLPDAFYEYDTRLRITGGGAWFVRDGNSIWFVQNNGADGDNWSHNNVTTGGAGAIGWKSVITPEMEPLVAILSERKKDSH